MGQPGEPTTAGLLRGAGARILRARDVFAPLMLLLAIVEYLLMRGLIPILREFAQAAKAQDAAAIMENIDALGSAAAPRLFGLALLFVLAAAVWSRVLMTGRPQALQGVLPLCLQILWRAITAFGWAVLLALPFFALYFLILGALGMAGVKLGFAGSQLIEGVLALIVYTPLIACFALAVVESASSGRPTPIHKAFDALGRAAVAYLGAALAVMLAISLLGLLGGLLLTDDQLPTHASIAFSGFVNALTALALLALAAAVHPHTAFARGAQEPRQDA